MSRPETDHQAERTVWDVNPLKTAVELTDGKIRMKETALYNGRLRVSEAVDTRVGKPECAWLYIQAESRDGADVKLTPDQAEELRDALDVCIRRHREDDSATAPKSEDADGA